ncbi:MAG: DUF4234 domain-containing protein [Lachnospiraceae bacterium]|nr:DUF4234 domain-containing protein [Lachnospiraceae bacterium]
MVKEKNIATCVILSLVTCGIYGIIWFVALQDDVNTLTGDFKTSGGMAFLLTLVTCGIYGIWWMYNQGSRIDSIKESRGIPAGNNGILYLILSILGLGIVSYCLMQNELNQLA